MTAELVASAVVPAQRPAPDDPAAASWALVERAQAGDRDAFGDLYRRYKPEVFRFVFGKVGRRELAEDLTSETFLRALARIGSVTWQGRDLAAWLVTIARNLVVDHYKSGRYRLELATGDVSDTDMAAMVSAEPAPETALLDRELAAAVREAVKVLTPDQLQVMELKYFRGMADKDVAAVMGTSHAAVKALAFRARQALLSRAARGLEAVR